MKQLLSNKWAWAVAVLVLLNIISISTVWFTTCQHHRRHKGMIHHKDHLTPNLGHHMGREFLSHELKLNDEQQKAFEKLRKEHFEELDTLLDKLQNTKSLLLGYIGHTDSNTDSLVQAVGHYEALIQRSTFKHFSKLYEICDESQKKELKAKLQDISRARKHVRKFRGHRARADRSHNPQGPELDEESEEPAH